MASFRAINGRFNSTHLILAGLAGTIVGFFACNMSQLGSTPQVSYQFR